jgi:hypothetical protein
MKLYAMLMHHLQSLLSHLIMIYERRINHWLPG